MLTQTPIPGWYTADWTPAKSRWELPQMTWEAIEDVIESTSLPMPRKHAARLLFRTLWLESGDQAPLSLLQNLLMTTAKAFDPGRSKLPSDGLPRVPTPATGILPRWTFTDLEMVLTCTWSGTALFLATERHHDLLQHRGEALSAVETFRQIALLTAGLPCTARRKTLPKQRMPVGTRAAA